jgi:NAD(P)-dependent dehydrogenase (short-subunit alcohol dehydrogenase family)
MQPESSLTGKVAIITGGGTGIGLAIAKRFGALGATLVIGSRNARNLERGSADLRRAGYDSLAVQIDVRKTEQVDEMVHRVLHHYGRIDILVNNAAGNFISRPKICPRTDGTRSSASSSTAASTARAPSAAT